MDKILKEEVFNQTNLWNNDRYVESYNSNVEITNRKDCPKLVIEFLASNYLYGIVLKFMNPFNAKLMIY